jgi:hypothetical protein
MDCERGIDITRRGFLSAAGAACLLGRNAQCASGGGRYSVAVLGDTHYDAEPESVYHSHYDESNKWAKVQHEEFRRNGEMWRERCPRLLAASADLAHRLDTRFVLQLGDVIQGDCDDAPTHRKMLDDCIRLLRRPYPGGLPFLTVIGNHDFRGKGARAAYMEFAEPFMSAEVARLAGGGAPRAKYPAFSFRVGPDLWVFCDFETGDLNPIADLVDADPSARHVFLVTHGPFTTFCTGGSYRWRLGGRSSCEASRPRLYETLSRRHAIVLSGHTHTTNFYRHVNGFGGFAEFTANSVWSRPELATAKPVHAGAGDYAPGAAPRVPEDRREDFRRELEFFRPGLRDYFYNDGAGHYRLHVADDAVTMAFYPGAATEPGRTFRLDT